MKGLQLEKASRIGASTRGCPGGAKQCKKFHRRRMRRVPVEEVPTTNRYKGWWW